MSVHIGEISSQIDVMPEASSDAGGDQTPAELWQEVERMRGVCKRIVTLGQRTCAEGFDD
jgi:hypothetical protein